MNDNSINARFCWQTRIRSRVISILSATPTDCLKKKSMLVNLFSAEKNLSVIFDFHFRENPRFRDERVQKRAAWRAEVPYSAGKRYLRTLQSESRRVAHCMHVEIEKQKFFFLLWKFGFTEIP